MRGHYPFTMSDLHCTPRRAEPSRHPGDDLQNDLSLGEWGMSVLPGSEGVPDHDGPRNGFGVAFAIGRSRSGCLGTTSGAACTQAPGQTPSACSSGRPSDPTSAGRRDRRLSVTLSLRSWRGGCRLATSRIRPSTSVTGPEKLASVRAYGFYQGPGAYEYDHLISLELRWRGQRQPQPLARERRIAEPEGQGRELPPCARVSP